jgi:hypothetical protein
VSLVVLIIFSLFVHRTLPPFVGYLIAFVWVVALFVVPIFVVVHILRNGNQTAASWLWTESILAGIWIAMGSATLLNEWAHGSPVSMLAIVIGVTVALTPVMAKRDRSFVTAVVGRRDSAGSGNNEKPRSG